MSKKVGMFDSIKEAKEAAKAIKNKYFTSARIVGQMSVSEDEVKVLNSIFGLSCTSWVVMRDLYSDCCCAYVIDGVNHPISMSNIGKDYKAIIKKSVINTLRGTIGYQVSKARDYFTSLGLMDETMDIQHCIPFDTLYKRWANSEKLSYSKIHSASIEVPAGINKMGTEQSKSWREYHAEHALMEPILKSENSSLGKNIKPAGPHAITFNGLEVKKLEALDNLVIQSNWVF